MDSILQSIKKLLGIHSDYTVFDDDIIIHINTNFVVLNQLNVGPTEGFFITDGDATWDEYIGDKQYQHMVKTFIYLKVKLIFDPPSSSFVIESMNKTLSELEFRLYVEGGKNDE